MEAVQTPLAGVIRLRPKVWTDSRGHFFESWNARALAAIGIDAPFVQDNHSHSGQHVLRGLHYQLRNPQGKLVRVAHGAVFDVAVDLRRDSPSFGRWFGTVLSAANRELLWLPPGLAHGFLVLSETAEFLYKTTDYYAPETERVLRWDDEELAIEWPLPAGVVPVLSPRDAAGLALRDAELPP